MNEELNEKYLAMMREAIKHNTDNFGIDEEGAHIAVDGIVLDLLEELGYVEIVELWCSVPKWFA